MNRNEAITGLAEYALDKELIRPEEKIWAVNSLLDVLEIDTYSLEELQENETINLTELLDVLLDDAYERGVLTENSVVYRDLLDTKLMGCLTPRPSQVMDRFAMLRKESSQKATDWYYQFSQDTNYIRKDRVAKDIRWKTATEYGDLDISINLSKPEKDPKAIAAARMQPASDYPKCMLCVENVGYPGRLNFPARQNHRIVPIEINGTAWYLQYSPYVYYNEHCIIFNENHQPMVINENTFRSLFSFVKQFPHYMLGSNADLPIVGGSILTHDHFQGGHYIFPIEGATVVKDISLDKYPDLQISVLNWPLSTIRVRSTNDEQMIRFALDTLNKWINYSNEKLDIIAYSEKTRHNRITPIVRKKNGIYEMDLVLRNNRTSEKYPDGIFHPHQNLHHIKKENIGLIEVMGLAVLPARLKDELEV